jgi:hypothetical protein
MNYVSILHHMQNDFNRSTSNEDNGSDLLSSGMLSSVDLYLVTETSEQTYVPIFKVQALFLERLTLKIGTISCSEASVTQ